MADTRVIGAGGATSDYLLSRVVWLAAAARELSVRHATCYLLITSNASSPGTLLGLHVASWLKPGPHQQQCRSNIRLCCQKRQQCRTSFALKFRPFDKVERCFDIVASVDRALAVGRWTCDLQVAGSIPGRSAFT